ncbi:hypothetical protein BpHYR1_026386 [Brachionus plicatilis]|uniref:Uncharacterized protein n=1 Tax=Brachionus plicatilis TaxID=10195 RepID=A0A3M7SUX5_BRAPC|nr:hypothetical protein BpHYR1_026386 [Brachionus plicatilis]
MTDCILIIKEVKETGIEKCYSKFITLLMHLKTDRAKDSALLFILFIVSLYPITYASPVIQNQYSRVANCTKKLKQTDTIKSFIVLPIL